MPMVSAEHRYGPVDNDADAALLELLTAPAPPPKATFARRDAALDPLMIAAAAASGPNVTRNHYHHDFFPGVMLPQSEGAWDWTRWTGDSANAKHERRRLTYVSRQAPRRQRLQEALSSDSKENNPISPAVDPLKPADNLPHASKKRRQSVVSSPVCEEPVKSSAAPNDPSSTSTRPLEVKCMARTRIPTPHGPVFLHLYHNNRDSKEHLAIVVDPVQLDESPQCISAPLIRSRSLDAVWGDDETEMDRIIRGAYVGRLLPNNQHAFDPRLSVSTDNSATTHIPPPIIRIHSECFTGETVGSMRCDCGEQLDEAIRIISQPITIAVNTPFAPPITIPGRGAVIYLRQEGRGIGLLSKIRAYNLQDLGHDTVTANLMLGHQADERGYEIAGAILRDLGLGNDSKENSEGVRVLTNNPDKVKALEKEGIQIAERVPMIPRSWRNRHQQHSAIKSAQELQSDTVTVQEQSEKVSGATLVGGNAVYGEDLDKYLRTKVLKMGHMLPLWMEMES